MAFSLEIQRHPEFKNGAQNRALGHSKSQSSKHLGHKDFDAREANSAGWNAMSQHLLLMEILEDFGFPIKGA